jgi:hypothetical protein
MSVTQLHPIDGAADQGTVQVEIVVPVYNEAEQLAASIATLSTFLASSFPFTSSITIADNASTDDTWSIAGQLADTMPGVRAVRLAQKGRGRALKATWSESSASVVAYMDVDLATGLDALLPLVAPLLSGHSDVAIGTRLAPGARVVRGTRREFISRGYNLLVRSALRSACTDAQCGFKAMRREAANQLLPLVVDDEWFFDTEILVTAQRMGLRIHEVPVDWVDDTDSRVAVAQTAWKDLCGVTRLARPSSRRWAGGLRSTSAPTPPPVLVESPTRTDHLAPAPINSQVFTDDLMRFAGIGAVSTFSHLALFSALQPRMGSYRANAVAIAVCSAGNTAAHRGMSGTSSHGLDRRHRLTTATALLSVSLGCTTASLAATQALGQRSRAAQLAGLSAANMVAACLRFGILRTWTFRPEFGTHLSAGPPLGDLPDDGRRSTDMTRTPS